MKLTVLLCVRNGMPYLQKALDSILCQSYTDYYFIIVNNASDDGSQELLNSIKDRRVTIHNYPFPGIIEAHNFGLSLINTEYTAIMDADDYSHHDRLKVQLEFLEKHKDIGLVGSSISYFGNNSNRKWNLVFPKKHNEIMRYMMKGKFVIAHPSIMFRTDISRRIGGYSSDSFPVPDLDFLLKFSSYAKLANISDIYHYSRISANSFTQKHLKGILFKKNILLKKYNNKDEIAFSSIRSYYDYLSVLLYKKALLQYLNDSKIIWIFYIFVAAFLNIPKVVYRVRTITMQNLN